MSRLNSARFAVIAAAVFVAAFPSLVNADQITYGVRIVPTPTSPVSLTHCSSFKDGGGQVFVVENAINRSSIFLTSFVVRWYAFDHSGVGMGQYDYTYSFGSDLAPNDTTQALEGAYFLTEPTSALATVSCRMQSAKFEGGRSWTFGRPWNGRLTPMPHQQTEENNASATSQLTQGSGKITGTVTNAWNDMVDNKLFVHVALDLEGADSEAAFGPQNVSLIMALSDGGERTYQAMPAAAPTYQKLDPLGQNSTTLTANEVDPKQDIGALGSLHIAAHGKAHIVATFLVGTDAVKNANDNRHVVVH